MKYSFPNEIRPFCIKILSKQGFTICNTESNLYEHDEDELELRKLAISHGEHYIFGMDRFISLGHIHSLFMYYTFDRLTAQKRGGRSAIVIMPTHNYLSCWPEFEKVNASLELNFRIVKYNPLRPELCDDYICINFLNNNGSEGVRRITLKELHKDYQFQSDVRFNSNTNREVYEKIINSQIFLRRAGVKKLEKHLAIDVNKECDKR